VFICEKCGSGYSAVHAVALQNCPRCQARDKISSPLTFKVFTPLEEQRTHSTTTSSADLSSRSPLKEP
jgi:predicted  nucleic acid-binding Zn-ribbon protein